MHRSEHNLAFWRSLVGLESDFPSLTPMQDEDLLALMVCDPTQMHAIHSSIASHQLTQAVVEPGWGRTSLFRYVVKVARDDAMNRLLLPIAIDLETTFGKDAITTVGLENEIKQQIIGLLMESPWEKSVNENYYFECINYDSSLDLDGYKARMRLFLSDRATSARKLVSQFPWLRGNLIKQVNNLLENLRIQTALYIHLPRQVEPQRIRDLVSAIKATLEGGSLKYAAWREVYFCGPLQRFEIGRDFERPFHVLTYPQYSAGQIYAMLVQRYTLNVPGFRSRGQIQLSSVFPEVFVEEAWKDSDSLNAVVEKVRGGILQRLDCPEVSVPFHLTATGHSLDAGAEASEAPTPSPTRKRFERVRGVG